MSRISPRLAAFILVGLLSTYLLLAGAFYVGLGSRVLGANDFYSRWVGARALWLHGQDPYADAVTREIQLGMYGRLARPGEDQVAFAYPLYAAWFALPFVGLGYAAAESAWLALLVMLVAGAAGVLAWNWNGRLSPLGLLGVLGLALAFYPSLRGIFLGQYTLIVFASLGFGLALIMRGQEGWAGLALAASAVKPHVAVLALAVILSWGVRNRRWGLVRGFAAGMAALLVPSFLVQPTWPGEFIAAVGRYQGYIQIGPPIQVLSELVFPASVSAIVAALFTFCLLAALLYRWLRTLGTDWNAFLPTVELAMIVTTMAMVRTATTDQTILLVPWLHWLGRLNRNGHGQVAAVSALFVVGAPWLLFLSTLNGNQEAPVATTGAALLTLIGYGIVYHSGWIKAWRAEWKRARFKWRLARR